MSTAREQSIQRLKVIGGHFQCQNLTQAPAQSAALIADLGRILDHDNHDMRKRMKEFMKADIYIP